MILSLIFVGAWVTVDAATAIVHEGFQAALAVIDCHTCINHDGGGGGGGFSGGFGGGGFTGGGGDGGGGGTAGKPKPPAAPVCTLDLTKDTISWTTNNTNNVVIVPLTSSPNVPGASAHPGLPGGDVLFNGDFGAFKTQFASVFQSDATAHGGVTLGNASFKANKATADRLCALAFPGTVNGIFNSDTFSSPGNNTIAIWGGSSWSVLPALGNDPHLRNNFTCQTPFTAESPFPLSGATNFIPPLSVGTHTYKLTASGAGGTQMCQKTIVVPPPPPPEASGCIDVLKETFDPSGTKITPVAQFSFKLDGATTIASNSNGIAKFTDVTPGTHTVTEVNPGSTWNLLSVTPSGGTVVVGSGGVCSTVVFKNQQVIPPPPPPPGAPMCTLDATAQKITWSSTNAASVAITPTTVSPSVGSNLTASGSRDFIPPLPVGEHFYKMTVVGTNGDTVFCGAHTEVSAPPPPPTADAPTCTLAANPASVIVGGVSSLNWTLTNAVLFDIDNGIGAVAPSSSGATSTPALTTTTTFIGTAKNAAGDSATCSATVSVLSVPPPPGFAPVCTLAVSDEEIKPGFDISLIWMSSNTTAGSIDQNIGAVSPVGSGMIDFIFPKENTTYTATFTGPNGTATCSASVIVKGGGGGGGGGGCSGNCGGGGGGGGPSEPKVSLLGAPIPGEVLSASFVSLSQIPYTGFEAGPLLTLIFWGVVVLWSFGITYIFIGQEGIRFIVERFRAYVSSGGRWRQGGDGTPEEAYEDPLDEYALRAPVASPEPLVRPVPNKEAPASAAGADTALPELIDVLESRAHAAGVLLSPEASAMAAGLHTDRAEVLRLFGDILDETVRTVPRDDGWILLSAERMRSLVESRLKNPPPDTEPSQVAKPTAPVLDDVAVERFVSALFSGDRDVACATLLELEHASVSPLRFATKVATLLDQLYRSRKNGTPFTDVALKEQTSAFSEARLQELVDVFAHALDGAYASKYTGLKIALAQALDTHSFTHAQ